MTFLEDLLGDDPVARYVGAFHAADQFVGVIEGISAPSAGSSWSGDAQAQDFLLKLKGIVGPWVDNGAPHCKELPSDIVHWDPELGTLVDDLQTLAQHPITPEAQIEIKNTAAGLLTIVKPGVSTVAELVRVLSGLVTTLNGADVGSFESSLDGSEQGLYRNLADLQGRLDSVRSRHCPSSSEISKLEREIDATKRQLSGVKAWIEAIAPAGSAVTSASSAIHFLSANWLAFNQELELVVKVATAIQRTPSKLTSFETGQLSTSWQEVRTRMAGIVAGLAA